LLNFIPRVTSNIQQNVVDILKRSKDGRMLRQQFEHEYKRCYNFLFDFNTLGFTTLRQALESLSHIVKVEPTGTDYCVSLVNEIEKSVLTTNKNDEKASNNFELKILQKIYNPVHQFIFNKNLFQIPRS